MRRMWKKLLIIMGAILLYLFFLVWVVANGYAM